MKLNKIIGLCVACTLLGCTSKQNVGEGKISISGIYPRLAYYNNEGECGTGAVVPWAGRLWVVTYAPHSPFGSSDKLYEVTPDYRQIVRDESIGGTPANRMVHRESNQLFIGPYAIDSAGNVRAIPYTSMLGRHTGNARHLQDPAHKLYYATMEEGFYSVDVKTLEVDTLYLDGNCIRKDNGEMLQYNALLPGAHGKGFYSGQGVAVYSNNREASEEALVKFDAESGAWPNGTVKRGQSFVATSLLRSPVREEFTAIQTPRPILSGPPDGIINRCCWVCAMPYGAGASTACPKQAIATTEPTDGIRSGLAYVMWVLHSNLTI